MAFASLCPSYVLVFGFRGQNKGLLCLAQKTDDEIEPEARDDPGFADQDDDWFLAAALEMPSPKQLISLRLDAEVVDWFKSKGQGYQTRINAALVAYVKRAKRNGGA